jgi:hypothetical protein
MTIVPQRVIETGPVPEQAETRSRTLPLTVVRALSRSLERQRLPT